MTAPHFELWLSAHFGERDDTSSPRSETSGRRTNRVRRAPSPKAGDDALVVAVRNGDGERFSAWYGEVYEDAWRFVYRFVHDSDQARDVVQDVFLSIWEKRESWEVSGALRPYIFGALRHRALNVRRHEHISDRAAVVSIGSPGMGAPGMGVGPAAPDVAVTDASLREAMRLRILALPERQRTALALRWDHGLSNLEIATILGVGEAAVSRLLSRATTSLRATWDELTA